MKCIVIDDEKIAREGLNEFIKEFDFLENKGCFSNANHALELLSKEKIDLIFLDIEMPLLNGLKFAKMISGSSAMIVFTTAYSDYAIDGYKVNAIDYLLKPIFPEDFKAAVLKAKKIYDQTSQKESGSRSLFLKENGIIMKIECNEIIYIQSLQNYIEVHLENRKKIIIHQTLKKIFEQLPNDKFCQIHKSFIINLKHVTSIDGPIVYLKEIALPIARSRREQILKFFK